MSQEARLGWWSSIATALGIVFSGPVALLVVARVAPQPAWQDAALFVRHYHPIQSLPYALGLFLIGGCVGLVVAASRRLARRSPLRATLATVAVTVFASLVALNYIVQTTFVPALVSDGRATRVLLVTNGVVSLLGGVLAAVRLAFIASSGGFAAFMLWNALMLVLASCAALAWRYDRA